MLREFTARAWRPFQASDWCYDPYAKTCERCETIVGRFAVMRDPFGWRQVMWWPHAKWDGQRQPYRCWDHSEVRETSNADISIPMIVLHSCGHREIHASADADAALSARSFWQQARTRPCTRCAVEADAEG